MNFTKKFLEETNKIVEAVDSDKIEQIAHILKKCRDVNGRLFFIGVGGSAAHCSHAVNDFRKICGFQAFTPIDNVSELTARINDEGWENCYKNFLIGSLLKKNDVVLIFSVGGGSKEKNISVNLINAFDYSKKIGSKIISITGKKDGYAYSSVMSGFGGNWTYENIAAFLYKPKDYMNGTKMNFAGLKKVEDRANLVLWLRENSENPIPLP